MPRTLFRLLLSTLLFAPLAQADLQLSPGTKIVFGDQTTLATAPSGGGQIPAGHGGVNNTVSGTNAYVGGGATNSASKEYTTVGAGFGNTAIGIYSTIGGGRLNTAHGSYGSVAGGVSNAASGFAAAVPGGSGNAAAGNFSFASGRRAKSNAQGATTFADSLDQDFGNSTANSFAARATGGVFFFTRVSPSTEGMSLDSNGNLIISGSLAADNLKVSLESSGASRSLDSLDNESTLNRLLRIPMQEFTEQTEGTAVSRLGFSSHDFSAAFGVGAPDEISLLDTQAVAFASIQALYDMIQERDQKIEQLESTLEDVLKRLEALE